MCGKVGRREEKPDADLMVGGHCGQGKGKGSFMALTPLTGPERPGVQAPGYDGR